MKRSCSHQPPARGPRRAGVSALLLAALLGALVFAAAAAAASAPRQAIYDSDAYPSWTQEINGYGTSYDRVDSAVANSTGVYVSGEAGNAAGNQDATLARYSSSGALQWFKRFDSSAHRDDSFAMIVKGPGGTIYAVGTTERADGTTDMLVVKWGADGSRKWVRTYDGALHKDDYGVALGVDKYGNVTAAGTSIGTHHADYVVVRWSSAGVRKNLAGKTAWRYNGSANIADEARDVHVESGGAAYVTGYTWTSGPVQAVLTVKFSAAGSKVWHKVWRGTATQGAYASSLAPRPGGGVYVAGSTRLSASNTDAMVLRYSSTGSGHVLPVLPSATDDYFSDVAVTSNKRIVAVGRYVDGANAAVLVWSNEDTLQLSWGFGDAWDDGFAAVVADAYGGFCATGYQRVSSSTAKIITIRRSVIDTNSGFKSLVGPAAAIDQGTAVAVSGTRVYVAGYSYHAGESWNQVVMSYLY